MSIDISKLPTSKIKDAAIGINISTAQVDNGFILNVTADNGEDPFRRGSITLVAKDLPEAIALYTELVTLRFEK